MNGKGINTGSPNSAFRCRSFPCLFGGGFAALCSFAANDFARFGAAGVVRGQSAFGGPHGGFIFAARNQVEAGGRNRKKANTTSSTLCMINSDNG